MTKKIDLSDLKELNLGPNWSENYQTSKKKTKVINSHKTSKKQRRQKKEFHEIKQKLYNINFVPCYKTLDKIKKLMKVNGYAYSLDEICELIIQRKNYKIIIRHKNRDLIFYKTKIKNFYFSSKEILVKYIIKNELRNFFEKTNEKEIEISENYSELVVCPDTGVILPPKSYHNFKILIKDHYLKNSIKSDFDKYCSRLKTISSSEIKNWKETIKKSVDVYKNIKDETENIGIDKVQDIIKQNTFERYYKEISQIIIKYSEINQIDFNKDIKINENFLRKDIKETIKRHFKDSKFNIFEHDNNLYIAAAKFKQVDVTSLNKLANLIISYVYKNKINTKLIISELSELKFQKKDILLEIKWLAKEGYVQLFTNGDLIIAKA